MFYLPLQAYAAPQINHGPSHAGETMETKSID